jgi:hypothetical protein
MVSKTTGITIPAYQQTASAYLTLLALHWTFKQKGKTGWEKV